MPPTGSDLKQRWQGGPRTMDQKLAEILVAPLADSDQTRFAAGCYLPRHQAEPRRFERTTITRSRFMMLPNTVRSRRVSVKTAERPGCEPNCEFGPNSIWELRSLKRATRRSHRVGKRKRCRGLEGVWNVPARLLAGANRQSARCVRIRILCYLSLSLAVCSLPCRALARGPPPLTSRARSPPPHLCMCNTDTHLRDHRMAVNRINSLVAVVSVVFGQGARGPRPIRRCLALHWRSADRGRNQ